MNFMANSNNVAEDSSTGDNMWTEDTLPTSSSSVQLAAAQFATTNQTPETFYNTPPQKITPNMPPASSTHSDLFAHGQRSSNVSSGDPNEAYPSVNSATYKSAPDFCAVSSHSQNHQPIKFDETLPFSSFQHYAFPQFAPNSCSATFSELAIIRPQQRAQDLGDVLFSLKQTTLHPNPTAAQHSPHFFGNGIGVCHSSNPFQNSPLLKPSEFNTPNTAHKDSEVSDLRQRSNFMDQVPAQVATPQSFIQPYTPQIYRAPYDLFIRGSSLHDDANASFNYSGIHGYNFGRFAANSNGFAATTLCNDDPTLFASNMEEKLAKTNVCHLCGKAYARPSTLKTHLRTHSGERPFKCTECSKSFSQAANLAAHVRTHNGEKPFKCDVCDRRFSQSSSVTTHMRTHTGARPYRCRMCSKSFSDSSTLTKHLRIHSGEKPYSCHICHIRFSQSGNLNRHMRIHQQSQS